MRHVHKILTSIFLISMLATITTVTTVRIAYAVPVEEWNKTFGGTGYDSIQSVNQTSDEGYILAGQTSSYGSGLADAWLIKTDYLGNKQWSKTFGETDYYYGAYSVQQTKDGGYIIAGNKRLYCTDPEFCSSYAWLIKTNSYGNLQWKKRFSFSDGASNIARSVQQTRDGGYIIAGDTFGDNEFVYMYIGWLIKTDGLGNIQWSKILGGGYYNLQHAGLYHARQTSDGGYIAVGYFIKDYYNNSNSDAWLIKTDSFGNKKWSKTFIGSNSAYSVQQTRDGGYILIGENYDTGCCLIKTDALGNKQWNKTIKVEWANDVQQTKDSGYILGGSNIFVKTDGLGNKQWSKTFKNISIDSIQQTKDEGYILGGIIKINNTYNGLLIKLTKDNLVNLLKNPGFEESYNLLPRYWNKYQTGTKAVFTYPETGRVGGKSVSIRYVTRETGKVALWSQSGIVVVPAKQYKLSGYMKLTNVTGGGIYPRYNGADLRINWYKSDGGLIKVDLITKSGTIGWTRYEKTFTSPSNAVKATVGEDLFNASGKAWFDDLSFVRIS